MNPSEILNSWIEEESKSGAQYAQHATLSTIGIDGSPRSRVIAIREINAKSILFFTQAVTRKVSEIKANPSVSLAFWFERFTREVVVEGQASFLTTEENNSYWQTYPKWAQVRFCSYAPTSGQPINSKQELEDKRLALEEKYKNQDIPMPSDYKGILITPKKFNFYTFRLDELSDVFEIVINDDELTKKILSP